MHRCFIRTLLRVALLGGLLLPPFALAEEDARWTINLRDADIRDFVEQVSSISGQTLVLDPRVKGKVTVISQAPLGLTEVYQLFLSVMSTHGYAVVTQGDQARIVPDSEARSAPSGGESDAPDTMETRLLQVQQTPVAELLPLIRPLVPQQGHLAAVPSANALIVSDRRGNIERLVALIAQLDRTSSDDSTILPLQHAWAGDIAAALQESLRHGQAPGGATTQVIADTRTNRLMLVGPPEARRRLVRLAQSMDVPAVQSANTRVIRLRHGDAKSLATTLGELSEQLRPQGKGDSGQPAALIRADESLNALVLLAEPDLVARLEEIVRQLDVPRAQVLVEAAIVEMTGDISDALGVQWAIDGGGGNALGGVNFSNTGLSVGTLLGAIQAKQPISLPDGAIIGVGGDHFAALVTALSANSKSNLLSTPSLLTLDNQKAEILVGQNVPFQTGSYTTDAAGANNPFTTIERKDVGVTLKVTPHINEGSALRLEIEQEISSIAPSAGAASQAVDLVTNKRSIKSTVLVDDGQVIVLGGLIQDDVTRSVSKVPVLGDVPLLGGLFRSTKDTNVKRNLMVFLRPSVVRDGNGLVNLSQDRYRYMRNAGERGGPAATLPADPQRLFPRAEEGADLRSPPSAQAAPVRSFAAPATPALARSEPIPALVPPPTPEPARTTAAAQRYSVALLEGSNEAYMRSFIEMHPRDPLHMRRELRDGQPWYRIYYGNYINAELAQKALLHMTDSLPRQRGKVVPL